MILRELIAKLGFDFDETTWKKFNKATETAEKKMQAVADKSMAMGKNLTGFLTLPILGAGVAMVKMANDAQEIEGRFSNVFSTIGKEAEASAQLLVDSYGRSSTEAKELLSNTGDVAQSLGFTEKGALGLSTEVNKLAVDLASYKNLEGGAVEASEALTKAIAGQTMGLKRLGIVITEDDIKAQKALMTSQGMTFQTEKQAEAMATLALVQAQSAKAIGDYAEASKDFEKRFDVSGKSIKDLAISFGKILLPFALKIVNVFIKATKWVTSLSDSSKKLILIIAGIAAAIGPLIMVFAFLLSITATLVGAIGTLSAALGVANAALLLLGLKFILIGALIAAGIAVVFLVIDDLVAYFNGEDSVTGLMVEKVKEGVAYLEEQFMRIPDFVRVAMAMATLPIRSFFSMVRAVGGALGALFEGGFTKAGFSNAFDAIKEGVSNTFDVEGASGGLGSMLGMTAPTPAGASGSQNNVQVNSPISIQVPNGTDPSQVGPYVERGLRDSLSDLFQETNRQVVSPIME